jgi:hypothetical protein
MQNLRAASGRGRTKSSHTGLQCKLILIVQLADHRRIGQFDAVASKHPLGFDVIRNLRVDPAALSLRNTAIQMIRWSGSSPIWRRSMRPGPR